MNRPTRCSKCGVEIRYSYICNEELAEHKMCFSCNYWRRMTEDTELLKTRIVVGGECYHYGEEHESEEHESDLKFRGCGGRRFEFRKFTGETVVTTNLWCQGPVPAVWLSEFPDNAELIS